MAEYIEREAAIKGIYDSDPNGIRRTLGFNVGQIEEALRAIPPADVAPVRHGRWIEKDKYTFGVMYDCSICDNRILDNGHSWNYCPNCGARMTKDIDEQKK